MPFLTPGRSSSGAFSVLDWSKVCIADLTNPMISILQNVNKIDKEMEPDRTAMTANESSVVHDLDR